MQRNITLLSTEIRHDAEGRYSLNDLHRAAVSDGENKRTKEPGKFLASPHIVELVNEITTQNPGSFPVRKVEGRNGGTYVCKELVYAYAMWVSPRFHLHVIRTFDRVATSQIQSAHEETQRRAARERARLECPAMTGALRDMRAEQGKTTAAHHYRNEADMLNRIILGLPAGEYREHRGIPEDAPIRDFLSPAEIAATEELQRFNSSLILLGMGYDERKARCIELFQRRHAVRVEAEVLKRIA